MFWYFNPKTLNTDIWNDNKNEKVDSLIHESPSWCSEAQNSAVAVLGIFFIVKIEQKQAIWCLKRMSININVLFIELLYRLKSISHLWFFTLHVILINYMKWYK